MRAVSRLNCGCMKTVEERASCWLGPLTTQASRWFQTRRSLSRLVQQPRPQPQHRQAPPARRFKNPPQLLQRQLRHLQQPFLKKRPQRLQQLLHQQPRKRQKQRQRRPSQFKKRPQLLNHIRLLRRLLLRPSLSLQPRPQPLCLNLQPQ